MLYQLHWQFKDGSTEMCSQIEIEDNLEDSDRHEKMRNFVIDTQKSHPLPKKAQWLMCPENSREFIWAVK